MKAKSALIAAVAAVGIASGAHADTLFVNMAGWQSDAGFPGFGTSTTVDIGAGSTITNIEFTNFVFEAFAASWTADLAVGVSDGPAPFTVSYWESQVPGNSNAPGVLGPVNAAFDNPGLYLSDEGFSTVDGLLVVYVYELFNDTVAPDAIVSSGGITITYTAIPAPGAVALLGLAGLVGSRRRRTA
jgi:hypothetical protein